MQTARKNILITLLVALVATAAAAGTCTGDVAISELPYSLKWTSTSDAAKTTFIFTVCNTQCVAADAESCRPISSVSIGASDVTTFPAGTSNECGPTFSGDALGSLASSAPTDPQHCEAFYVTAAKSGATQKDVCGGDCQVQITLDNGIKAVGTAGEGGSSPSPAPTPASPSPTPYGRRRRLQQVTTPNPYGRRL